MHSGENALGMMRSAFSPSYVWEDCALRLARETALGMMRSAFSPSYACEDCALSHQIFCINILQVLLLWIT